VLCVIKTLTNMSQAVTSSLSRAALALHMATSSNPKPSSKIFDSP
jgi:hypothetical protein